MIAKFVQQFMFHQDTLLIKYEQNPPGSYFQIVKDVVELISSGKDNHIDPDRIHQIDDGDYQGTKLYIIAESGYQPDTYYYVKIGYGSCSGCDTLERVEQTYRENPKEGAKEYLDLARHIVQGLHFLGDDSRVE